LPSGSASSEAVIIPPTEKIAAFGIGDTNDKNFGKSDFTANLGNFSITESRPFPAAHYVVLVALPLDKVARPTTEVLKAARNMLDTNSWYMAQGDSPKYWSRCIFPLHSAQPISKGNSIVVEEVVHGYTSALVRSRLAITSSAETVFAAADNFVYLHNGQIPVFQAGPILARCWSLSALVAQLYHDIGYTGKTYLCIGMANTLNSHLGGAADGQPEAFDDDYKSAMFQRIDWSCHSLNLKFCEVVDLLQMKPKEQPKFIEQFAEAMAVAYNHDAPRCFDKLGRIPERYFK
jgi:hypothetical protein